jgi:hypothetical protein
VIPTRFGTKLLDLMQDTFFQFQLPLASLQVRINSFDDNNEKKIESPKLYVL